MDPIKGKVVKLKDDDNINVLYPVSSSVAILRSDSSSIEETLTTSVRHREYTDENLRVQYPTMEEKVNDLIDQTKVIIGSATSPIGVLSATFLGQRYKGTDSSIWMSIELGLNGWKRIDSLILSSPNGSKFAVTVADDGTLSSVKL